MHTQAFAKAVSIYALNNESLKVLHRFFGAILILYFA